MRIASAALLVAATLVPAAALSPAANARVSSPEPAPLFRAVDVGTFGGRQSFLNGPGQIVTPRGAVLGSADTTIPDHSYPNHNPFVVSDPDPQLPHAFSYWHGRLTDIGALPGNNGSAVFDVNRAGLGVGISETGTIDPRAGYQAEHAVLFRHERVVDLGTLPGGTESQAIAVNDRGLVAGFANNGVPDPLTVFAEWGTQIRGFVAHRGRLRDLGTLGGPDTTVTTMNERGQVTGDSYLDATVNPKTGAPTTHPFIWQRGRMRDLGTLGGTQTATNWINDRGEVVGVSRLADDETTHPFLWDGHRLRDLGTLGGTFGTAFQISNSSFAVGGSTLPGDEVFHAAMWRNGHVTDLADPADMDCSFAEAVNDQGDAVGHNCDDTRAYYWHHGHQYDLTEAAGLTDAKLTAAAWITNRGEIVSRGQLIDGSQHVFLLRPIHGHRPANDAQVSPRRALSPSARVEPCDIKIDRTLQPLGPPSRRTWLPCD